MVIKAVLGMTIAVCAACSYKGSFVDCEVACGPPASALSSGCPLGFTCEAEGRCRSGATMASCAAVLDGGVDSDVVDSGNDGGAASCPAVFNGGRYLFVNTLMEWPAARMHCTSLDSTPTVAPYVHLVVVNDSAELGQLTPGSVASEGTTACTTPASCPDPANDQCIDGRCVKDDAWLGYTDSKLNPSSPDPAKFLWITDEQSGVGFAMWTPTSPEPQPDDSSGPRCAYKDFSIDDGLMHDRTCTGHTRTFFCECDDFAEDPTNIL